MAMKITDIAHLITQEAKQQKKIAGKAVGARVPATKDEMYMKGGLDTVIARANAEEAANESPTLAEEAVCNEAQATARRTKWFVALAVCTALLLSAFFFTGAPKTHLPDHGTHFRKAPTPPVATPAPPVATPAPRDATPAPPPDQNAECHAWAVTGQCTINPAYMMDKCQTSCRAMMQVIQMGGGQRGAKRFDNMPKKASLPYFMSGGAVLLTLFAAVLAFKARSGPDTDDLQEPFIAA